MGDSTGNDRDAGPPAVLKMDHVFDALAHPRRRYLLYALRTDGKRPLWELSRRITAWEGDVPDDAVSQDAVERVYISLYHNHVPKLASDGIITFSEAGETIEASSNSDDVMAVLDIIEISSPLF